MSSRGFFAHLGTRCRRQKPVIKKSRPLLQWSGFQFTGDVTGSSVKTRLRGENEGSPGPGRASACKYPVAAPVPSPALECETLWSWPELLRLSCYTTLSSQLFPARFEGRTWAVSSRALPGKGGRGSEARVGGILGAAWPRPRLPAVSRTFGPDLWPFDGGGGRESPRNGPGEGRAVILRRNSRPGRDSRWWSNGRWTPRSLLG